MKTRVVCLSLLCSSIACSPVVDRCDDGCAEGTTCNVSTGLCVRSSNELDAGNVDLVPGDAGLSNDAGSKDDSDAGDHRDGGIQAPDAGDLSDAGHSTPDAGAIESDAGSCQPGIWYRDDDGDGFGSSSVASMSCTRVPGTSATSDDCDDSDPLVNPSRAEQCDSSMADEDCDGQRNEGCGCVGLGSTRSCCSGRGVEVCEQRDGGTSYSLCSAPQTLELCNGLDDDCNGLTDDLPLFDGGMGLDGGVVGELCRVGVGQCVRSGATSCQQAVLLCPVDAGSPSNELCNGLDDDCNGLVDEASNLCSTIAGQTCVTGACSCPPGQTVCGASCRLLGGSCAAGVGACRRAGTQICSAGSVTCDAVPGQPTAEICNGLDDDCDGSTDETGSGLCPASGQSCTAGACACPAGQSVCGSACRVLGNTCSVGVGACQRTGTNVCAGGSVTCDVVPGQPTAEICNGLDDDCDG